jgi:hypothetical protein
MSPSPRVPVCRPCRPDWRASLFVAVIHVAARVLPVLVAADAVTFARMRPGRGCRSSYRGSPAPDQHAPPIQYPVALSNLPNRCACFAHAMVRNIDARHARVAFVFSKMRARDDLCMHAIEIAFAHSACALLLPRNVAAICFAGLDPCAGLDGPQPRVITSICYRTTDFAPALRLAAFYC